MASNVVDILDIDCKIHNMFTKELQSVDVYKTRYEEIKNILSSKDLKSRMKIKLEKESRELEEKINNIESCNRLHYYISETGDLIQKYKECIKKPLKISFMGTSKTDDSEKLEIVRQYLEIASKYYEINVKIPVKKFKYVCDNCDNKKDFIFDETYYICVKCSSQQEKDDFIASYKDVDRVNITAKYSYDRRVHFRDCINQYQGKENCTIHTKVYEQLEDAFESHHLLVGDKNTPKAIRFKKITKDHVLMFLKELSYSKHYENVNLIHYTMTDKKPDDISHLEDKLIMDFDKLADTYDKYCKNNVDRVNFISTQYVLYQLLQRHKHPCKREDFVILKTIDGKNFHDEICQELFNILNWNFTPLY